MCCENYLLYLSVAERKPRMFSSREVAYWHFILFGLFYSTIAYKYIKKIWNPEHIMYNLSMYFLAIILLVDFVTCIPTMGHVYAKDTGILKKFFVTDTTRRWADRDQYTIVIENCKSGKIEKYKSVPVDYEYNLKNGMELEICSFRKEVITGCPVRSEIAKINGKTTKYFIDSYRIRPYEREFSFSLMSIYGLALIYLTRKNYVASRKKYGTLWYRMSVITCILYGTIPWIAYWEPEYGRRVRACSVCIFLVLAVFELLFSRSIGMPEYQEEWQKVKCQMADEEIELEKREKIKELKKQILLEEDKSKIYQFKQMSHYMSKQYCDYKYHKRMKNSMEGVVIFVLLELIAAILIPIIYDNLFKWYGYMTGGGVMVAVLIFFIGYVMAYHKNKRLKDVTNTGYQLEYCIVVADVYNLKKFICSDGHMEEWKMKYDDDAKIKDGQEAVVIYSPATHEMFTERKEVMNKICGI